METWRAALIRTPRAAGKGLRGAASGFRARVAGPFPPASGLSSGAPPLHAASRSGSHVPSDPRRHPLLLWAALWHLLTAAATPDRQWTPSERPLAEGL